MQVHVVYVTKYALTQGVLVRELIDTYNGTSAIVEENGGNLSNNRSMYHPGEWHKTMNKANAKAESMRKAKIASLQKQIAKLEKMEFV